MDETEIGIEIACWNEKHPEAGASLVDLPCPLKRGTFALALGNLVWNIEIPNGYRNRGSRDPTHCNSGVDPARGYDAFKVSIVKKSWKETNPTLEDVLQPLQLSEFQRGGCDATFTEEIYLDVIINSQELQVGNAGQRPVQSHRAWTEELDESMVVVDRPTESLSDVLDFAYRLATLYEEHRTQTADVISDELLQPDGGKTSLIELIAELVTDAHETCTQAAGPPPPQFVSVSEEHIRKAFERFRCNSPSSSTSVSNSDSWVTRFRQLDVNSPSEEVNSEPTAKGESDYSDSERDFGSDGESSDSDWVVVSDDGEASERKSADTKKKTSSSSRGKRKVQQQAMQSEREPSLKRATKSSGSRTPLHHDSAYLKFCTINFNRASRSVECSFDLSKLMKPAVARALGFNLEHSLRVEIVPIPVQLGAWSWYGDVEVYASQESDYHNHIPEEEICGLLCLIPTFVQTYFHNNISYFYNTFSFQRAPHRVSEKNIFTGVLAAIAKHLTSMSDGGYCCVCGKLDWSSSSRQVWTCKGNLCQATYEIWQSVTSDAQRQAEDCSKTEQAEQKLREHFTFLHQGELEIVLDAYGVTTDGMCYEEMISALAKIETWAEDDTDSCTGLAFGMINAVTG